MKLQFFIALGMLLLINNTKLSSQEMANKEFQEHARVMDSTMMKAYNDRDTKTYLKALDAFLVKYEKLSKEDKKDFKGYYYNSFYNLCCTYSLLNEKVKALEYLDKSIKAGFVDYAHMQRDTDLDNIRKEASFIKMLQPLRETGDYLYILKKAGTYNKEEKRELPKFTYQSADNPNLVALRKAFNLDSIAGQGNDVSKILNLMHWMHNTVRHDGNNGNPPVMNAMSMMAVCKKEGRGLNCRGLAMALNECYLSMGIQSRYVTCLPKDSLGIDNDCHVINMVYSKDLKKWLWMDPTFDAYVMNEKGELLSIEEVRDRIVNDKPIILNPDANWNRRNSQTKEYYLYTYMAKNLYMLECPLSSEYDTETRATGKTISYLRLVPLDYFKKSLETSSSTDTKTQTTFTMYRTNNPAAFWE